MALNNTQAKNLITKLKETYPKPTACGTSENDKVDCCVGGIFIQHLKKNYKKRFIVNQQATNARQKAISVVDEYFPNDDDLARVLKTFNNKLSDSEAFEYATSITENNDNERFSIAWLALKRAISFGYKRKKYNATKVRRRIVNKVQCKQQNKPVENHIQISI